jgi:hypothetical protein
MTDADTSRLHADFSDQTGIFNPDGIAETLTIIGCGGIGASALPTLVTMGFRRYVLWDDDVVEPRNVASQLLFKPSDLYRPKVEVAREYLLAYGATQVDIVRRKFTADDEPEGIVISGVDSMAARKEIWPAINASLSPLYLDGRIGSEHMSLLTVEPFDADWYEKRWLFDDAQGSTLLCAQRAIVYPAVALGGWMASHLAMWSRGITPPRRVDQNLGSHFFQVVR